VESFEAVKEQVEPELEFDLVVAPAEGGVFVVVAVPAEFGLAGWLLWRGGKGQPPTG
jgi:hypothetical protein